MEDRSRAMLATIEKTKRREELTAAELQWLLMAYLANEVPDYQVAAWLMAVCLNGLRKPEIGALTEALVASGRRLDLRGAGIRAVDKHSTGGIGDKTTLVLAPLVAAAGLTVAKMSGRGLSFTGGTLDKLESIPGLRVDLSGQAFLDQARTLGLVISGQTSDLAPGDGKLYALRDVTGTVDSIPLIAASILSKKLAAGASTVILDVKMGGGAFIEAPPAARQLAQTMVDIGKGAGLQIAAALTWMDQPLGFAIGNALELREAIATLRGQGPSDLHDLCWRLGAELLLMGGAETSIPAAEWRLTAGVQSGAAVEKLAAMVAAQGGDRRVVDDPSLLPQAPFCEPVLAPTDGYVEAIAARALGYAAVDLGAGRTRKGAPIDHATGIVLTVKVGDRVAPGQPVAYVHARTGDQVGHVVRAVGEAMTFGGEPPAARPLIAEFVR